MEYPIIDAFYHAYLANNWTGIERTGRLPSAYTELSYIENNGNAYIDTGIFPNGNTKVEMTAYVVERVNGNNQIYNARGNNKYFGFSDYIDRMNFYYGTQWTNRNKDKILPYNLYLMQTADTWLININENIYTRYGNKISFISDYPIYIFGANNAGTLYEPIKKMRLYYFRIWENGETLSRDFIPCKRNSDNVIGLYDLVSNTFYTNPEAGSFVAGEEIQSDMDLNDFALRLHLPIMKSYPLLDALISAADGQQTEEENEILRHYLTPLGIGGI